MGWTTKRPRTPDELWDELLTRRTIDGNNCWNYTWQRNRDGYGKLKWMGATVLVHRAVATIKFGVPLLGRDIQICHSCNNKACFNPEHIYIGNESTNQLDSILYGNHKESRKTHCPQGHPYDDSNTVIDKRAREYSDAAPSRKCRICKLERQRKWWAAHGKEWRAARKAR